MKRPLEFLVIVFKMRVILIEANEARSHVNLSNFCILEFSRFSQDLYVKYATRHMTRSHLIVTSPVKWLLTIDKICVKMPLKPRQNQGNNGFSSRGTRSNRPDLRLIPQPKG